MTELRKYAHEDRVKIARQISDQIVSKFRDSVLAVFICGSTAKNLDRPYSDLELIAVVRDDLEIPIKYYLYRGIVVEVDYYQESNILKAAHKFIKAWPMEADQYRNRIVLFERDGWTEKLSEAVAENEKVDSSEAVRFAAVELTEDLSTLLNAHLTGDSIGIRLRGRVLAGDAAGLVLLLNRQYVTTTSWYWKQAFECPWKPKDFETLALTSAGLMSTSPDEIVVAAQRLYDETMEMVRSRGVAIETDELTV